VQTTSHHWRKLVSEYASIHDMTENDALRELATRDSLETAVSLLGATPEDGGTYEIVRPLLTSFEEYLAKQQMPVPPKWSNATYYARMEFGTDTSGDDNDEALRDRYIKLRQSGVIRSECAKALGISINALYDRLDRWGMKSKGAEANVLGNVASKPLRTAQERVKMPAEYKRTLRVNIELTEAVIKESINALVEIAPDHATGERESITDTILYLFGCARDQGIDVAGALVQKLREVSV
jgi:hypothetical protein